MNTIKKTTTELNFLLKGNNSILVKDGLGTLVVKLAYNALTFIIGVVLVRIIGIEQYGIYSYVIAIAYTLAVPAEFGLPNLIVRETAQGLAKAQNGIVQGIWRWSIKITFLLTAIILIGGVVVLTIGNERFSQVQRESLIWGILLVPFIALGVLSGSAMRGLNKVVLGQLPDQVLLPGFYMILLILAVIIFPGQLNSASSMALRLIAAALALILGIWILWRLIPSEVRHAKPIYMGRRWISSTLPLSLTSGLYVINDRAGTIILGIIANPSDVGIYQVAIRVAALTAIVIQIVSANLSPQFASLYTQGKMGELQHLVTLSSRVMLVFNLAVTMFFIIFGKSLLTLVFGPDLIAAYVPLLIMIGGQVVNSLTGAGSALLIMTGREKHAMLASTAGAIINIVVNFLLVPKLGINGAAIATAASMCISQVLMWIAVMRILRINSMAFGYVWFQ